MGFTKTYTENSGDSLFAANGSQGVVADGYTIAGATGVLKRGTALVQGTTARELQPVATTDDQVVAILADDVDTAEATAISVYEQGEFNRYAISFVTGTYADYEVKARMKGIYFKDVVKTV